MEKEGVEGSSIEATWIPQTPMRPVMPEPAPIYTDRQEEKAEEENRVEKERCGFPVGNMPHLDHLPFGDLLALANAASVAFVGATPWAYHGESQLGMMSNGLNTAVVGGGRVEEPPYGQHASQQAGNTFSAGGCFEFFPVAPQRLRGNPELKQGAKAAPGARESQCITENWEPVSELSLAAASVPGESSNNTENGLSQGIEQIKSPPKPRRRKHRPKVVKEAKPKRDPKPKTPRVKTPKPADGQEKQTPKRKYVRKKGVNKDSASQPLEAVVESADAETSNPAKKSCRRALDFKNEMPEHEIQSNLSTDKQRESCRDMENQPKSGFEAAGENQMKTDTKLADERETVAEKRQVDICDSTRSENQESRVCISSPGEQAPNTPLPTKSKPRQRKRNPPKGKEQNENGSNTGSVHHDQRFVAQFMAQVASSAVSITEKRQGKESTSGNLIGSNQIDTRGTDLFGLQYDNLQEYQKMSWLYFPNVQQKKTIPNAQGSAMSSTSCSVSGTKNIVGQGISAQKDISAPNSNCCSFASQPNTYGILTLGENGRGVQSLEPATGLDHKETSTKKRSRGHARFRDLASINKVLEGNSQLSNMSGQFLAAYDSTAQANIAVVPEMQLTANKRKRTKKPKEGQINQQVVLQNHYQFSASATGTPPDELWKQKYSIDAISEQLRLLDINRAGSAHPPHQETALVPYTMRNQENALVLYRGDGTIVPFRGPLTPAKKRRPRPRVDLDNETNRVWGLLMEDINNDGIDGTDEEKAKWWEEERRVFQGRADSFIARMHLVQGDRRFTPWKGSVVDSVVGVFLTQNVSDHLSSSAFMSVAAHFPIQSGSNTDLEERTSLMPPEPIIYFDSEESMSTPPVCNQSSITEDNIRHNEEKESVHSYETSRSSSEIASSTHESPGKVANSSVNISEACSDSNAKSSNIEVDKRDQTYLIQDRVATQDLLLSDDSVLTSQSSMVSVAPQNTDRSGSCSVSNSEGEDLRKSLNINGHTSFMELLQMAGSSLLQGRGRDDIMTSAISTEEQIHIQKISHDNQRQSVGDPSDLRSLTGLPKTSPGNSSSHFISKQGETEVKSFMSSDGQIRSSNESNERSCSYQQDGDVIPCHQSEMPADLDSFHSNDNARFSSSDNAQNKQKAEFVNLAHTSRAIPDITESTSCLDNQVGLQRPPDMDLRKQGHTSGKELNLNNDAALKSKGKKILKEKKDKFDWDSLRRQAEVKEGKRERTSRTMDSVDWEAVRTADVNKVAKTIKDRGMNNVLAGRIQDFLNRLVREHGSIDLEWLRDVPPDKAKEYLLSFRGLGLKSVECVRLLTLHHLAFPVDTNVGRIAVRLGWVPLQPLPETLQLHLLELYPILESIQKYLWPRLCKLDQKSLYELHYQMITFGKVFCTKSKPNCNACPMRGECRHFASAFASARLALPSTEEKSIISANDNRAPDQNHALVGDQGLLLPQAESSQREQGSEVISHTESTKRVTCCEPIIEEPPSPEPEPPQVSQADIEDAFFEDPEEIPTIKLNMDALAHNLKSIMDMERQMSTALVALTDEAASIPMPKLKNVSQLRTEHQVYELPDSHPLLAGLDKREPDDPCSYLLAIWTPGETADSIQPPESKCSSQEKGILCDKETCFSCNSIREARSQIIRGTLLIPCRTAMRGSFPLNGTYFQVNEVFADHESSQNPIDVPRDWIWNLPRKTVYFGTSMPSIFRGLSTECIQHCFWRGYVCVRGFDRKTRAPRPLIARLHFPASKMGRGRGNQANADDA